MLLVVVQAQTPPATVDRSVRAALRKVEKSGKITAGVHAVDVASGAVITSWRADSLLIPASNQKAITAGAAVLALGSRHEIVTDLIAHGVRADGTLTGSLRLRGEGDPMLVSEVVLPRIAERVRKSGIRRVTGDLLVDDRLFDQVFRGPGWPSGARNPSWKPFLAGVSALALDYGTVRVRVGAARSDGAWARAKIIPAGAGATLVGRLATTTNRKRHVISVNRKPGRDVIRVSGRVLVGTKRQDLPVAVHDPALSFARALLAALRREGVTVDGVVRRPQADEFARGGHLVARLATPVSAVLPVMLRHSQNHCSEMLYKHCGAALVDAGSFAGGGRAVRKAFKGAGVDLGPCVIADGSGLSRDNRVTATHMVKALHAVWTHSERKTFVTSLAYGGEPTTTLRRRYRGLGKRLHAKTGLLDNVIALSGFIETTGGRTIVFSILMNARGSFYRGTMRSAQAEVVSALARTGKGS